MRDIFIRKATLDDASVLTSLSNQLGYQTTEDQLRFSLNNILDTNEHAIFVAYLSNKTVVGWIHIFITLRVESGCFAEIGGLVVSDLHRRMGIGKCLIEASEKWALQLGINKLRVRSQTKRSAALAFYKNIGFSETKEQQVFDKQL
jgi:GNAT superfamily N-acetyltransferase